MNRDFSLNRLNKVETPKTDVLRRTYITKFINTSSVYFNDYTYVKCGYFLWCCYKQQEGQRAIFPISALSTLLDDKNIQNFILFWDYDISDEIMELGRNHMFYCSKGVLLSNINAFPQDMYLLDETLTWTIALTHEQQNESGDTAIIIEDE
ncbi:hypothetical protein [Paenibacillus xerothermodurans]|uniref:DUF4275 family protein n=1 Tax=Paenibacillus xerothermodurans TaxID=1977292 RepID=A0A2W1N639_PAEXE|nr:hypothetical protein [Paenibacillus xerothermodurans]PZE19827.1 hypothetical protein CBW46_015965 [Paenibacillus xerothermodurans]